MKKSLIGKILLFFMPCKTILQSKTSNIGKLSKKGLSKEDFSTNIRTLLLYILHDCEKLGSLAMDLNIGRNEKLKKNTA